MAKIIKIEGWCYENSSIFTKLNITTHYINTSAIVKISENLEEHFGETPKEPKLKVKVSCIWLTGKYLTVSTKMTIDELIALIND